MNQTSSTTPSCILCGSETKFLHEWQEKKFYRCGGCESVILHPDFYVDSEAEKSRYEEHINDVDDPGYQRFVADLVDAVQQNQKPEETGLDFGSGTGPVITKLLTDAGYSLKLYDPFFHPAEKNLKLRYDYIIACEVIEHLQHPMREFRLLENILKPGGNLYLKTYIYHDDIDFPSWHYKNDPTHVIFYSKKALQWISDQLGLELRHCKYEYIRMQKPIGA